jgi:hypothetical protein
MRGIPLPTLLLASFALPIPAQKVCFVANENNTGAFFGTATSPFVLKETTGPTPALISAIEFYLKTTSSTTTTVELYDEDPVTGKPNNLLGSGPLTLTPTIEGWYGGVLPTPVLLLPNTNFFVGINLGGGIQPMLVTNGSGVRSTPHWWNKTAGWSGPHASYGWRYRVYCFTNQGAFATYGTGKSGSGSAVPEIHGLGFPNTTNTVTIQLARALGGAPAVLLWGRRSSLPTLFGTVYSFPILVTTVHTTNGSGSVVGWFNLDITLPDDPSLSGAMVAFQYWVVDAGAQDSLSHSNGLEMTIGH